MAGFNPHVGTSPGGYTALPSLQVSGVLDSIVSDLGSGINGWSLYDDVRANGASFPILVPIYTAMGVLDNYYTVGNSWNFINGQNKAVSYSGYGRNWGYSISALSGVGQPTPITTDGGVNWYDMFWSGAGGSFITASLDRNYAGATAGFRDVFTKLTRYVVFKQSSANKVFYLLVGQRNECTGTPNIYMQAFEDWNASVHTGTNGGQIDAHRFYWEGSTPLSATCRYISWFLPDAFALWTGGEKGWGATVQENFSLISVLDTYGMRSGDSDAVCAIHSDTTLSGYHIAGTIAFNSAFDPMTLGAIQCLRTLNGETWSQPSTYGANYFKRNAYQLFPRGRPYNMVLNQPLLDLSGRFEITSLDLWHAGWMQTQTGQMSANEGRRGKVKYVKLPCGNPAWMHLGTMGPAEDGNTYIFLRISPGFQGFPGNSLAPVLRELKTNGWTTGLMSGWGCGSMSFADWLGDWYPGNSTTMQWTYMLMPIS
jgi:hypothetical protein